MLVSLFTRRPRYRSAAQSSARVSAHDIPGGTFLGFYSGTFAERNQATSMYAATIHNRIDIFPFVDESDITETQRHERPLANMNEPNKGQLANCAMLVQDFAHDEVDGVERIPNHRSARYFRGLACFTCVDVPAGQQLVWHYGASYEANRIAQGYEAGLPCVPATYEPILRVVRKVPHTCVYPITGAVKSARFKTPRPMTRHDSDTSSSGSGHLPKYTPAKETRAERLAKRKKSVQDGVPAAADLHL